MLVGIVSLLAFSGCGKGGQKATNQSVDWSAVSDDDGKRLTLRWQGPVSSPGWKKGSWIQNQIESKFNVEIDPVFLDSNAYRKKRGLMMMGGNISDLLWEGEPLGARRNVHHGFVLELPYEVIEKHAPHYVAYLNSIAPETWLYSRAKGKNWGLPTVSPSGIYPTGGVWRKDWLEAVGLHQVPETLDEMAEAFDRFTHGDPDGNGRADTYGCSPTLSHWSLTFAEVFAAEGVLPYDLQEVNGSITWGGIRPEAKEVLARLRDWYARGLIDPDFILNANARDHKRKFLSGQTGYLPGLGNFRELDPQQPQSLVKTIQNLNPAADLVVGKPLRRQDSEPLARVWGASAHIIQFGRHLSESPEKIIRVLKIFEAMISDEDFGLESLMGKRGLHWEHDQKNGTHLLEAYKGSKGESEFLGAFNYLGIGYFRPFGLNPGQMDALESAQTRSFNQKFRRPEWGIFNALGKTDVLESAATVLADLRVFQEVFYIELIRGDRPMSDFDIFVKEWLRKGGAEILEEAQSIVVERKEMFKQLGILEEGKSQ